MRKSLILIIILLGCVFLSCSIGRYYLSFSDIVGVISNNSYDPMHNNIFLKIRLPRTVFVAVSGFALAVSGFVYQGLFKNPLVSPDVLGISNGCSVGAICGIVFAGGAQLFVQTASFLCGLIVVFLSVGLSKLMGGKKILSMILSGIILGAFANSIIMVLKYTADPTTQLTAIEYWLMGSFNNASWSHVRIVTPIVAIASIILFAIRKQLMVLTLSDEDAQSLGVNVGLIRMIAVFCSTILVSSVVSVAGIVAWIGLIVPHITRFFAGHNFTKNIYQTGILGSALLLIADTLSRSVFTAEVPISIFTSLISGIFLLIFLYLKNKEVISSEYKNL